MRRLNYKVFIMMERLRIWLFKYIMTNLIPKSDVLYAELIIVQHEFYRGDLVEYGSRVFEVVAIYYKLDQHKGMKPVYMIRGNDSKMHEVGQHLLSAYNGLV